MSPRVRGLLAIFVWGLLAPAVAFAQRVPEAKPEPAPRDVRFSWNPERTALYASLAFRDVVDGEIRDKLSRGLPTKLLMTGILYAADTETPLSSTYQSCKITWHVWEEMYRVELTTPEIATPRRLWTPTLSGVLRRCAQARSLLVANRSQLSPGTRVSLRVTVRVNPISDELMKKLKRWVSLPSRTTAAAPGSALFSTFTGLFMQRIGDAEKTLVFQTRVELPE